MAIRERLSPAPGQIDGLSINCAHSRFVYNIALEQRNYWTKELRAGGLPTVSRYDQQKSLSEARKHTWLKDGSSAVQQGALMDLDRAFKNFFRNPKHFGYPSFRRKFQNEGFTVRDNKVRRLSRKWGEILVPKVGWVRFRATRLWADIASCKSARVKLDRSGRWWVSFVAPQPIFVKEASGAVVGVDVGIANSVTTSDDAHLSMPATLTPGEKGRLLRLQRKMARQVKGSNRRAATRLKIARLKAKQVTRRKDWIEKTTTGLVRDYDLIGIEDLKITSMTRSARGTVEIPGTNVPQKAGLNREILNQSWGLFRQRLTDKATAAITPTFVVAVNPANSSRRCHACGNTGKGNRESQATFHCVVCGHVAHADVNAAKNIRDLAVASLKRQSEIEPLDMRCLDDGGVAVRPPMKRQPAHKLVGTGS